MSRTRSTSRSPGRARAPVARTDRHPQETLAAVADGGASVVLLGAPDLDAACRPVLAAAGIRLIRVASVADAVQALADRVAQVVLADGRQGPVLTAAVRVRPDIAAAHVIVCAALDSPDELRDALDAGADDVMRVPFEPGVLAARVGAGLRAARLRAGEALLRSLVANLPGAVYRCACDADWTMEWLSDEIETISGYPAAEFVGSSVRTFASIIHPDDREQVERSVMDAVDADRPFTIEYRIQRRDATVRWVLERGQAQATGDGRRWLDGAIFDITARRAAERALREHEIVEGRLAEVHASRARILEAADRARREIERNLHDGAQQRFVSAALQIQVLLAAQRTLPDDVRAELRGVLAELRAALAELRQLAHGLHPTLLTDHGLGPAIDALARRSPVPVEVDVRLPGDRFPAPLEGAAYFTVCEALTNVAKYARATAAWVRVEHRDGRLAVEVGDNGVGGASPAAGTGLQGLADRIAAVDGSLEIDSPAGTGTVVRARLPLDG